MQQAFAAAESGEEGPNLPNLDFRIKFGETVSLKLSAKVTQICLLCLCLPSTMMHDFFIMSDWLGKKHKCVFRSTCIAGVLIAKMHCCKLFA